MLDVRSEATEISDEFFNFWVENPRFIIKSGYRSRVIMARTVVANICKQTVYARTSYDLYALLFKLILPEVNLCTYVY